MRLFVLFAILTLAGCSHRNGAPESVLQEDVGLLGAGKMKYLDAQILDTYGRLNDKPLDQRHLRNRIVSVALAVIDHRYGDFRSKYYTGKAFLDTSFEIVDLGLDAAITVASGSSAKAILGAIATGLEGAHLSIDKNFFLERTIPALVNTMDVLRTEVRVLILGKFSKNVSDYPLELALRDLVDYYNAGTIIAALSKVTEESATQKRKSAAAEKEFEKNRLPSRDKQAVESAFKIMRGDTTDRDRK